MMPAFSIVLPTWNRRQYICIAIDSVLAQTYQNFELIIADDGSTDGTLELLKTRYEQQIKSGKIKCLQLQHVGVCNARNAALATSKNEWIAYVDSDNIMRKEFLGTFAYMIQHNQCCKNFYCKLQAINSNAIVGKPFSLEELMHKNFIDLGAYVHHRSLYEQYGGFDTNMTRFVDWDMITTHCQHSTPIFVDVVLLDYNDAKDFARITTSTNYEKNMRIYYDKHALVSTTTILLAYNQEDTIRACIEGILMQVGRFRHNIVLMDDCSTDKTFEIIQQYANHPNVKVIKSKQNIGQAKMLQQAIQLSQTDYISIVEGDDLWIDPTNLSQKINMLQTQQDCSMVFSKIRIYDVRKLNSTFTLKAQQKLQKKLSEQDLIDDYNVNPIGNWSCCLFRTEIMKQLPVILFDSQKGLVSEVAVSFYCAQHGKLAFIDKQLTLYKIHTFGVWSGANNSQRLDLMLNARKQCYEVCSDQAKSKLAKMIESIERRIEDEKNRISMHS